MDEALDSGLLGTIASMPVPPDLLKQLQTQLQSLLPHTSDPELVALRLQRFIAAARSPTSLLAFFERDRSAFETLLRMLGAGQRLAEQLIADPESFDLVRASGGGEVSRDVLVDEIAGELDALASCGGDDHAASTLLRAVAGRERLRIAYAEFVAGASPHRVSAQLSVLAEAILESSIQFVSNQMEKTYGWPRTPTGERGRLSVIGYGAFGGRELGYHSPVEWMFLCELCGPTDGKVNLAGEAFFRQLCSRVLSIVRGDASIPWNAEDAVADAGEQAATPQRDATLGGVQDSDANGSDVIGADANGPHSWTEPPTYTLAAPLLDVSIAKRPLGASGPIVTTVTEAHRHYQSAGRTWERLLHVKSRVVAGDESLGIRFLELIGPWVYRRYLQRADQEGLHTLMRKFARRLGDERHERDAADTSAQPTTTSDVRKRDGGLDDIDSIVALLQLINGGELPELRVLPTCEAIQKLLAENCLTVQEAVLLSDHYHLLKRVEHCVQVDTPILKKAGRHDDSGTPQNGDELPEPEPPEPEPADTNWSSVAWNLGYRGESGRGNEPGLFKAVDFVCHMNRQTILRLLADADVGDWEIAPETELVLDPDPDADAAAAVLARHGMNDPAVAMDDLRRLANEPVPFLSSRRCRHFLARIAPELLTEVAKTPDPHHTLRTLADVSDSLGAKAVLWELLGTSAPAMSLFIRLCACSPYLTGILVRNPGMIDELIDSLILDRLPSESWLEASSVELCRTAADVRTVLQGFKNGAHLQIGVRDCLGKESLEATHASLAATAEAVVRRASEAVLRNLADQFGDPVTPDGEPVELVILALGKLGAREPNYHSNLEAIFLYTHDCQTRRRVGGHRTTTTTANFFGVAASQIAALINDTAAGSRLFELGTRLTIGSSNGREKAAASVDSLSAHFLRGQATLPQRLALCKARAISGSEKTRRHIDENVRQWLLAGEWFPMMARQVQELRIAMERSAAGDNLKRAAGGTVDVELITQTLQLCHAQKHPEILVPGTLDALARITDAGLIDATVAQTLRNNYRTLREVESKIRLLDTPQRHEIPTDPHSLDRLAFLMGRSDGDEIVSLCRDVRASNRGLFNSLIRDLS
jgi:[glutamine synthetase] adenylyltransferase / [glutamine synthetase]-adenylyl-L-tyrosine phosphorylase